MNLSNDEVEFNKITTNTEPINEKPLKTTWYEQLKDNPAIFNAYKEHAKQKYLERKDTKHKLLNGEQDMKTLKQTTPEEKAKYKANYYNSVNLN